MSDDLDLDTLRARMAAIAAKWGGQASSGLNARQTLALLDRLAAAEAAVRDRDETLERVAALATKWEEIDRYISPKLGKPTTVQIRSVTEDIRAALAPTTGDET